MTSKKLSEMTVEEIKEEIENNNKAIREYTDRLIELGNKKKARKDANELLYHALKKKEMSLRHK